MTIPSLRQEDRLRVLVTGAGGFIGRHLCARLAAEGFQVVAAVRSLAQLPSTISQHHMLLSPITDWTSVLKGVNVVVHLAARVHQRDLNSTAAMAECRRINVESTIRLAEQSYKLGVQKFIFMSTIKVFGESNSKDSPITSASHPNPHDAYALSKYEAELAIRSISNGYLQSVIIRPPLVYGTAVKANFGMLLKLIRLGVPLPFKGIKNNKRSFVGIENLVDFTCAAIKSARPVEKVLLVSDGESPSTAELIYRIAAAMNRKIHLYDVPMPLIEFGCTMVRQLDAYRKLTSSLWVDIEESKQCLGWSPPFTFDESLKRAVNGGWG